MERIISKKKIKKVEPFIIKKRTIGINNNELNILENNSLLIKYSQNCV